MEKNKYILEMVGRMTGGGEEKKIERVRVERGKIGLVRRERERSVGIFTER